MPSLNFCQCGCGAEIPQFTKHRRHEIMRFKRGHHIVGLKGEKHPSFKIGRTITKQGYVWIQCPSHPQAMNHGYVSEHRLVMERAIGRYLQPGEVVHHINGKRQDNRIENLEIFSSHSEHEKRHSQLKDMSDRVCLRCALTNRDNGYRRWVRHNGGWVCMRCWKHLHFQAIQVQSRRNKDVRNGL